ncbi:hypothetical protein EJB05_47365 [Eragrostis curvula]|uniref:Uncharacterized protein n=1 Tax=Eragrostis curvula TaxID=38414 RepID=A0A5J9T7H7_9POAL|nr:hypothetical protein EJB05_47365 [Eragrostis curvula]
MLPLSYFLILFCNLQLNIPPTTDELQKDDPKAVNIHLGCDTNVLEPLRGNISSGASDAFFIEKYVLRFYVTMDDLCAAFFMQVKESPCHPKCKLNSNNPSNLTKFLWWVCPILWTSMASSSSNMYYLRHETLQLHRNNLSGTDSGNHSYLWAFAARSQQKANPH